LITQLVAIGAWFLIVDFPDKAHKKGLLSEHEAAFIAQRIEIDRGDAVPDPLTMERFLYHIRDFKLWAFGLLFMGTTMPAYALAYFSPVIVRSMGYSVGVTHLLGVPPVVFAVISSLLISWASDKYKKRGPAIAFQALICITGLMMTAYCKGNIARYWGLFFGFAGCQGNIPSILAYQSNNIRTQSKRSVGSALQIGFGAIGGIMGSTVFRQQDAPRYVTGLWVTAGLQMMILTLLAGMTTYFWSMNKKVDNGTLTKPLEGQQGFKFTY
jgi:predicted MFS family arabinose efflux permease